MLGKYENLRLRGSKGMCRPSTISAAPGAVVRNPPEAIAELYDPRRNVTPQDPILLRRTPLQPRDLIRPREMRRFIRRFQRWIHENEAVPEQKCRDHKPIRQPRVVRHLARYARSAEAFGAAPQPIQLITLLPRRWLGSSIR